MGSVTETMNGTGFPPNQSVGLGPAAGDTELEDGILCRTMRDKERRGNQIITLNFTSAIFVISCKI